MSSDVSGPVPGELEARFVDLDEVMTEHGTEAELCLVGGAIIPLVFTADPESRRPRDLFGDKRQLEGAAAEVQLRLGLESDWLRQSVRGLIGAGGPGSPFFHGTSLRVFDAPPDYVLAMKCAALQFQADEAAAEIERDIGYLLRFLGIEEAAQAIAVVGQYLNERQRPPDLLESFQRILT